MKKNPLVFIEHILKSIELIEEYTRNNTKESFIKNQLLQDSIVRRLEIIGEAVKNIPSDIRNKNPDIPWTDIAATRDKIIHHYFGVDLNTIWYIIKKDLPELKNQIKNIIKKEMKE